MRPLTHDILLTDFDRRRLEGLLRVLRERSAVDAWNLEGSQVSSLEHVSSPRSACPRTW